MCDYVGPSKPITPAEVTPAKRTRIPDPVIDAFNELIAQNWDGHSATVRQKDVVRKTLDRLPTFTEALLFERHCLDVEGLYRAAGWDVHYDKPGFNEDYEATFTFTKKVRRKA